MLERFAERERAKGKVQLATAAERSAAAIRRAHGLHQIAEAAPGWSAPLSLGCVIGAKPFAEAINDAAHLQAPAHK